MLDNVFCLLGPTASGKTALAVELVSHFPFEIISVDSAMIYRGMDIGTAKPSQAELAVAPHHLIDILDPSQSFSAAQFCEETMRLCSVIFNRGKIPLLVGGTMMYFKALQQGLSTLPEADVNLRTQLIEQATLLGWAAMHEKLMHIDPQSANKIHPNDTQRIQRALEVFYLTGKPVSIFLSEQKRESPYTYNNFLLFPNDRRWLHARIAARFEIMLQQGFINEVEVLLQKWQLPLTSPAMRCVGYRQAYDYLAGINDYTSFCNKSIAATRQLAKRQLTWLRHWPQGHVYACDDTNAKSQIMAIIGEILDNPRKQLQPLFLG